MNPPPLDSDHAATPSKQPSQPKALRFVTNYGAPHPKRRRIGAACLTCRKRKTACSGERPHCDTCTQNKLACAGYTSEAPPPPPPPPPPSAQKHTAPEGSGRHPADVAGRQRSGHETRAGPASAGPEKDKANTGLPPSPPRTSTSASTANNSSSNNASTKETAERDLERDQELLFPGPRNRMPYFRWLGPTAIMPGFKQMVVKIKRQDKDVAWSSTDGGVKSPSLNNLNTADQRGPPLYANTPAAVESDVRTPLNLPFYDTSSMPPSELITHLANVFFTHLGCNYPFLQRKRFLSDLEAKQVDAILVDAVCALASRFSTHALLTQHSHDETKPSAADYGNAFAQRAKTALVDTFTCPSVAAVQAALLLAYNEFGESRDSGLWMYLGIAIRMAQDLGLHKLEGLRYKGRGGPTPKMVNKDSFVEGPLSGPGIKAARESVGPTAIKQEDKEDGRYGNEQEAVEQERVDTFWAVFFLDRVVSSGTGRRSTLRDKDIELSFPSMDEKHLKSDWPAVFPGLIRVVHLYGRVADLLNSIKDPHDITSETSRKLILMEKQVTSFYQGLAQKLHFDAVNFQHYMKAGEGTNFVLLHFWFHTLIVLLHQPTLLKTFEGRMLQLFPNSRQLSMSSAKTIADILSYSQLMDAKASLGNPFTTQPIYIAACAFLKETADQSASSSVQSRATSPSRKDAASDSQSSATDNTQRHQAKRVSVSSATNGKRTSLEQRSIAKHTLLATAASQHYQLCYKALQSLETYWAGTKYILTILDQKFQGVDDPLLYTAEEGESSIEQPKPVPAFTSPGWRRKLSSDPYTNHPNALFESPHLGQVPGSPAMDPSKAIGWTLTGTMNSPSTNLAWHYASDGVIARDGPGQSAPSLMPTSMSGQYGQQQHAGSSGQHEASGIEQLTRATSLSGYTSSASHADADLLLGLGSPYPPHSSSNQATPSSMTAFSHQGDNNSYAVQNQIGMAPPVPSYFEGAQNNMLNFSDMMIESQDVDMSMLGLDMMPWFDSYPTHDVMNLLDTTGAGAGHTVAHSSEQRHHRTPP